MRKKNTYFFFLSISILIIISSCTLQKRHYTKGFYFNRISKHQSANSDSISNNNSINLTASTNDLICLPIKSKASENLIYTNTATTLCDTIILKNGVKMLAKVISAGQEKIIYKNCENNKDELLNMESSNVASVHYADGNNIDFKNNKYSNPSTNDSKKDSQNSNYKDKEAERGSKQLDNAIICLAVGLLFSPALFAGLILGALAKVKLENKPGYEKEYRLARGITIAGIVLLVLSLILIVFALILIYGII